MTLPIYNNFYKILHTISLPQRRLNEHIIPLFVTQMVKIQIKRVQALIFTTINLSIQYIPEIN